MEQERERDETLGTMDTFHDDKGQKSSISGHRLHWIFNFTSSVVVFLFLQLFLCNSAGTSPKIQRNVSDRHDSFGPDILT